MARNINLKEKENMENHIFKKVREFPLKLAHLLKVLLTKFKYNVATCKLIVHKTSTREGQLLYS